MVISQAMQPAPAVSGSDESVGSNGSVSTCGSDTADVKPLATLDPDLTLKSQVRMVALQLAKGDPEFCRRLQKRLEERGESTLEAALFPMGHLLMASGSGRRKGGGGGGGAHAGDDGSRPSKSRSKRRRGSAGDSEDDTLDSRPRYQRGTESRRNSASASEVDSAYEYDYEDQIGGMMAAPLPRAARGARGVGLRGDQIQQGGSSGLFDGPRGVRGRGVSIAMIHQHRGPFADPTNSSPGGFDLFEENGPGDKSASDFEELIGQLPSPRGPEGQRWSNGSAGDIEAIFAFPATPGIALGNMTGGNTNTHTRTGALLRKRSHLHGLGLTAGSATEGLPPLPPTNHRSSRRDSRSSNESNLSHISNLSENNLPLSSSSPVMFTDVQDLVEIDPVSLNVP